MTINIRFLKIAIIIVNLAVALSVHAVNVGSNTAVSLQPTANFNAGTNNILAFGAMVNGFTFGSNTTTCTFQGMFPVSGVVSLNRGVLSLSRDLIIEQPVRFPTGGVILGNSNKFDLGYTATDFALTATFLFKNTNLIFNSDTRIYAPLQFGGRCKIMGSGATISLLADSGLIVRPNSQLILEDVTINNAGRTNIRCLTDSGSLIVRNTDFRFSADYTFSQGSILFNQETIFTGTSIFAYTSGIGSTIDSLSTLMVDQGMTLSYAPRNARGDLLIMTDQTSTLYLRGCSLFSTYTGLHLQTGTLLLDDQVTMTSEARNSGEALLLNSNLTTKVMGGANVYMYGRIKYQ